MPKYIDVDAFVEKKRELYCAACERRMGVRNGHAGMIYEIGDAPCRACGIDDMLGELEDFPAADVVEVRHGMNEIKTNGDTIRKMTDAELAYVIMCPKDIDGTGIYGCEYSHKDEERCYKCALKWLQQEAEK